MNMFAAVPEVLPSSAFHLDEKLGNGQDRFVVAVIDRTTGIMWKPLSSFDGGSGNTKFKKMIQLNAGWDDAPDPIIPPMHPPPMPPARKAAVRNSKSPMQTIQIKPDLTPVPQNFAQPPQNPEMNIMQELAVQYHVSSEKVAQEVCSKVAASPEAVVRCGHCGCRFTSKTSSVFISVKNHPLIHLKEKAFRCRICNTMTNEFKDHMRNRHPAAKIGPDDELIRPEIAEEATRMLFQCFPDFGWRESEEQEAAAPEIPAAKRKASDNSTGAMKKVKKEMVNDIVTSKQKFQMYMKESIAARSPGLMKSQLVSEEENNRKNSSSGSADPEEEGEDSETSDDSEPLGLQYNRAIRVLSRRMNQALKKGNPAYCATCGVGFTDPTRQLQKVRSHLSSHLNGKVFKCHLCPSKVNEISSHLRQAHLIQKSTDPPQIREELKVKAFENICLCFPEYITCLTAYVPAIISAAHTSKALKKNKAVLVIKKGLHVKTGNREIAPKPSGVAVSRQRGPLSLMDIQRPTLTLNDIVTQKPISAKKRMKTEPKPLSKVAQALQDYRLESVFNDSAGPPQLEESAPSDGEASKKLKTEPRQISESAKEGSMDAAENSEKEAGANNENSPVESDPTDFTSMPNLTELDEKDPEHQEDDEEEVIEASIDPEPMESETIEATLDDEKSPSTSDPPPEPSSSEKKDASEKTEDSTEAREPQRSEDETPEENNQEPAPNSETKTNPISEDSVPEPQDNSEAIEQSENNGGEEASSSADHAESQDSEVSKERENTSLTLVEETQNISRSEEYPRLEEELALILNEMDQNRARKDIKPSAICSYPDCSHVIPVADEVEIRSHALSHIEENRFECAKCKLKTTKLRRHITSEHSEEEGKEELLEDFWTQHRQREAEMIEALKKCFPTSEN